MGMTLPGELTSLLSLLGYDWPQSDESQLFELGQRWMDFAGTLNNVAQAGEQAAQPVWTENSGANISAFADHFTNDNGPTKVLQAGSTGANVLGAGMTVAAGIMLALKVNVIVQLTTLAIQIAQAIASAVVTFGASLSEIPTFEQITRALVEELFKMVTTRLLNA
jgi:hypothetical protein